MSSGSPIPFLDLEDPPPPDHDQVDKVQGILPEDSGVGGLQPPFKSSCGDGDGDETFFERFSSIKLQYEKSQRRTIEEFRFTPPEDVVDGEVADQMWHTLGGWNIDELYSEVLSALLHVLEATPTSDPEGGLTQHLQQAFRIDPAKHGQLLEAAKLKKPPSHVLNLEVVEARGLKGKDINGLSDPFCTLYISSWEKHNTSIKPSTLNPVWKEYFSLPLNTQDEMLHIEVLDYDPEETLSDKMRRFSEVKSTRGLRILMKEIALTASTGKHTQEFLGSLRIPLKNIPPEGLDRWFNLEGKNGGGGGHGGHKSRKKGEIHVKMGLGAKKEKKVALQEFRHALHLLLVHELDSENVAPYAWEGTWSTHSETILHQLQWQGGLSPRDIDLAKWLVFCRVHSDHPFNTRVFPPLFEGIRGHLDELDPDEKKRFWFLTEKLIENFTHFLRTTHQSTLSNPSTTSQVYHMLKTLSLIRSHLNEKKSGFTSHEGGLITGDLLTQKIENSISRGATELFMGIHHSNCNEVNGDDSGIGSELDPLESEIEKMVKLGQLLIADAKKGLELYQAVFKELVGIDYFDVTYRVYDEKFGDAVQHLVERVNRKSKPIHLREDDIQENIVNIGTNLFELYLAVKQFSDLSINLTSNPDDLSIRGAFHNWFHPSVAQWLDIALYKAMKRIKKAVQIDTLRPLDELVQHTSSAVDTAHIFHQIQIFWSQLAWPEVEGSKSFITKILDDLCRCTIYYAEIMVSKVGDIEGRNGLETRYEISDEVCLAINNIEHVAAEMAPISGKLGAEEILQELGDLKGQAIADQCRSTLTAVMDNANESIQNKIWDILDRIGSRIRPMIDRLLMEGSETEGNGEGVERLVKYLDSNLIKLNSRVSGASFNRMLAIIWEYTAGSVHDLIRSNIEKRRPPTFFRGVHRMLLILINFFYPEGLPESIEASPLEGMQSLIELHGAPTPELIQKYLRARWTEQKAIKVKVGDLGQVTVRALYVEDVQSLKIEVLNARNLKPQNPNGSCDPYLKVKLSPESLYPTSTVFKTKVKKRTLFPLFDEIFSIPVKAEDMSLGGGFLVLALKDHDLFGRNDYMGDAYIPLESIPFGSSTAKLRDLPQVNLNLSRPSLHSSPILGALEGRANWDRVAYDFAKKERLKVVAASQDEV